MLKTKSIRNAGRITTSFAIALTVLILALIGFRLYLPTLVKNYVNKTLAKIPGYRGHIDAVEIALWRGAYAIDGLKLLKVEGNLPVPFIDVDQIEIAVQWRELFHGALVGSVDFQHPVVNFVAGPTKESSQATIDKSAAQRLRDLSPLRINHIGVHDGTVHFRNFEKDPHVDIFLQDVEAVVRNLTNSRHLSKTLAATVQASGKAMKSGAFDLAGKIDPYAQKPTFDMTFELKHLDLVELNDFLKRYGAVRIGEGNIGLYMEAAAKEGTVSGYIKPILQNVGDVHLKDEKKSLGEVVKGVGVKIASVILKNTPKDRIGLRTDFSGKLDSPNVEVWTGVASLLRNAFIRAITPGLDQDISVKSAEKEKLKKEKKDKEDKKEQKK